VLLDIKIWDPERHRHLTGSRDQRHARPLANVALEAGKPSWMRWRNRRGG
jgi:pyruvate-formate lyase-activating enzyme